MKRIITLLICIFLLLSSMPSGYASSDTIVSFVLDGNTDVAEIFADLTQNTPAGTYFSIMTPKTSYSLAPAPTAADILRSLTNKTYTDEADYAELLDFAASSITGGKKEKVIVFSISSLYNSVIEKAEALENRGYSVYLVTDAPGDFSYDHIISYTSLSDLPELLRQIPAFSHPAQSGIIPMGMLLSTEIFTDVPLDHWAAPYIYNLVNMEAIQGNGDGTFTPENNTTVAEFLAMVIRLADIDPNEAYGGSWEDEYANSWNNPDTSDDPNVKWYTKYMGYALYNDRGWLTGNFTNPEEPITRELAFYITYEILKSADCQIANRIKSGVKINSEAADFSDNSTNSSYANAINKLYECGILEGYLDDGATRTIKPAQTINRAEISKVLFLCIASANIQIVDANGEWDKNSDAGFDVITAGTTSGTTNSYGGEAHNFLPQNTGYYSISCDDFMVKVYVIKNTNTKIEYIPTEPVPGNANQYILAGGVPVVINVVGEKDKPFELDIDFVEAVTAGAPAEMEFTPAGGGTFIYSNNIEGIQQLSDLADNGADSKMLMRVSGLTENGITSMGSRMPNSNKYTFAAEHASHLSNEDIVFDLQFLSSQGAVIEITALGVGRTWDPMNLNKNYLGTNIEAMPKAVPRNSSDFETFSTGPIAIDSNGRWLKDIYEEIKGADSWPKNDARYGETPTFLLFDFNVLEGSVDLSFMAYKKDNRQNVNMSAPAPYRFDKQYKGYAATLPKVQTNLEFTIDDSLNGYLPVKVSNMRNPDGIQVNKWGTGINPQSDLYGQATYGAESAILPLEYYDISKKDCYGSAVAEEDKEDTWYFNTKRTDLNKEIKYGIWNGNTRQLISFDPPYPDGITVDPSQPPFRDPYFKPNAPLGNLSEIEDSTTNDKPYDPTNPDYEPYNIGYGDNVTSFDVSANLGNYWVEHEYTVTVHNLGSERTIEYWADGPGDYIIKSNGRLRNRGENQGDIVMDTFTVPSGTHTFTFSVMLYRPNEAALDNSLKLTPLN